MKKIGFLGLAALAAASLGTAAHAETIVGTPGQLANDIYFDYTLNVGGSFGNTDPEQFPPLFQDFFEFTTTFARLATVEISSAYATGNFSQNVNFVSNGTRLNFTLIPATSTGQFENRFLANVLLPAGLQTIKIQGSSAINGSYAGTLSLSGVPEPATWAFMIIGFGAIGAASRRRIANTARPALA
jgi:hypothetical protein